LGRKRLTDTALGGDSITAMQMLARCRKEGINITLNQVLRSKSLAHVAETISQSGDALVHVAAKTDVPFGLSPIQHFYFKSIGDEKNSHFNQSFTLRMARKTGPETLKKVVDAVVNCHAMLRARFIKTEVGEFQQVIPGGQEETYKFEHHTVDDRASIVELVANMQKSLDIIKGPVFAVALFDLQDGEQILFITAHHLVVDVVSWRVILGDIEESLQSGSANLQPGLPFQLWCEKQVAHTLDPNQIEKMKKQTFEVHPADLAFWGLDKRQNVYGDVERDSFSLEKDVSDMALNAHGALRTDVVDLFVAAIVHSFSRVFITRKTPTVFNETHGREPWDGSNIDLSRTVGWFTTMYPVTVPIDEEEDEVVQTVRKVKDVRRRVSENGRPYYAHRFLTDDGKKQFTDHDRIEVLFNYLGKMQQLESDDALFQPVQFSDDEELLMSDLGAKTRRPALFEISASVSQGKIQFSFMYNRWMKNQKGIRRWIAECQRTLEEIVQDVAKIEVPQPTISDFPLLPLESYDRLDRVIKSFPSVGIVSYDQVEDMYPCAAMQEGMILSQIKDPESYLSYSTFEVKLRQGGRVDVKRVASAWEKVVKRHPALRTVFVDSVCKGGVFDQIVLKNPDSGVLTYTCRDSELQAKLDSIKYSKLNGKKKPRLPHQFSIIQTNTGRVICKMEINHAVIDGGSHAVIRHDLEEAYEGRLSEEEGPLYSDYIKYLRSLPADAAVNYWKAQLKGLQPCYFPIAPQHSSKQRQLHSLYMDFGRFADLQGLAERNNVTFSNIMLTAWALVLRAFTGSSDVCYGYLTSGRNVPIDNIENAVGAFINMLVSRVGVSRNQPLLDVFRKVQNDFIESLPHQHCSLAQFQHDLGLSGKALFNTAVSVQNHGAAEARGDAPASSVTFEHFDAHDPSEFAITVNIDATKNDEGVRFSYWTDSVSDDMANNVASTMAKILTQVLADPNQTISELDAGIAENPKPQQYLRPRNSPPTRPKFSRSFSSVSSNTPLVTPRSVRATPRFELPDPMASTPPIPRIETPGTNGAPDWGNLIRNIVSEMVPQIVDQVLSKNKGAPQPAAATVSDMTNQMVGMLNRRASQSLRGRGNIETGSIRSRRMSVASDAESRIQTAADMVAAAGVMATEALKSVPPDFVEKKLLTLWSELLDMVEDSIDKEDSFFQLGGDSIIAMRLVGAAREEGLSMTVADIFKNPTFADMARVSRNALIHWQKLTRIGCESCW
jgi:non-ribosomal peptide synthase protein (TIGR01720 family)